MSQNKGFDFDGCHKHREEQSARIAGMYSNKEEIFLKAKEEKQLKAKKEKDDDDEDDDKEDEETSATSQAETADEGLDEGAKVEKAAFQTLGVEYDPEIKK